VLERVSREQHVRLNAKRLGDCLVTRVTNAGNPNQVDAWPVDPIPCPKGAHLVVLHEQARAEHVERIRIGRLPNQRGPGQRGGVLPPSLREAHAGELAQRTRRLRARLTNAIENDVGAVECGVAAGSKLVESCRQQAVAV
jgi:hypothetical protein